MALVIAGTLSGTIAGGIYDGFLAGKVKEQIVTHIPAADTASIKTGLHDAIEQMPGFVKNALDAYDLGSPDAIVDSLGDTLSGNVDAVAQTISDKVIPPGGGSAAADGVLLCFVYYSDYCGRYSGRRYQ